MLGITSTRLSSQPTDWTTAPSVLIIPCCPGYKNSSNSLIYYSSAEPNYADLNTFVARGGLVLIAQGEYYDRDILPSGMSSLNTILLDTISSPLGVLDTTNEYYSKMEAVSGGVWPSNLSITTTYSTHWYLKLIARKRSLQSIPNYIAATLYGVDGVQNNPILTVTQPVTNAVKSLGYIAWIGCDWSQAEGSVTGPWSTLLALTIKTFSIQGIAPAPPPSPPFPPPYESPSFLSPPSPSPPPFPPLPPGTYLITTFAGTGFSGSTGDGGLATTADIDSPFFLAFNPAGTLLYIVQRGSADVRFVSLSTGIISTVSNFATLGYSLVGVAGVFLQSTLVPE